MKVANDNDWYMGSLNDDGSVICWSIYDDLYEALRGLQYPRRAELSGGGARVHTTTNPDSR
ncbi:hypothetical protein [Streptomyces sp. NPDC052811]|uniref:hypothetical protein n=1 Tax=Streptomyces sp. NPDC052811 TaxID=3155731 RepID=UPI0034379330